MKTIILLLLLVIGTLSCTQQPKNKEEYTPDEAAALVTIGKLVTSTDSLTVTNYAGDTLTACILIVSDDVFQGYYPTTNSVGDFCYKHIE
jgi:hypothetical protein